MDTGIDIRGTGRMNAVIWQFVAVQGCGMVSRQQRSIDDEEDRRHRSSLELQED